MAGCVNVCITVARQCSKQLNVNLRYLCKHDQFEAGRAVLVLLYTVHLVCRCPSAAATSSPAMLSACLSCCCACAAAEDRA